MTSPVLSKDYLSSVVNRDVELHKRLKAAFEMLSTTEQLDDPPMHFVPLAAQLITPGLMKHRNPVRTLSALPMRSTVCRVPCVWLADCCGILFGLCPAGGTACCRRKRLLAVA